MTWLPGMRPQHWKDETGVVHGWLIDNSQSALPRETYCGVVLATKEELDEVDVFEPLMLCVKFDDLFHPESITCIECLLGRP